MSTEPPFGLAALHGALVGVLAQAHTHVDLSGSTRVVGGLYLAPPAEVPFACVAAPEVRVEEGRARREVWEHTATFRIRCWAPCTGDAVDTRVRESLALGDDLIAALEDATRDHASLLFVVDPPRMAVGFDPVVAEQPMAFAFVELVVEIRFRRVAGT